MPTQNKLITSRTDRAAAGFLMSVLQLAVVAVLQVVLVPVVIYAAGQATLGAYAAISQMLVLLSLLDLGFGVAGGRFLARAFGCDDGGKQFGDVMATVARFYTYMNMAYSACAAILGVWAPQLLSLTGKLAAEARYSLFAIAVWAVVRNPLMVYHLGLMCSQKLATGNFILTVGNMCRFAASIVFVMKGWGLFSIMAAGILGEAVALTLQRIVYVRSEFGRFARPGEPDARLFKEIFSFSRHAIFLNVAYYAVFYSDSIIVSYLYGPLMAACYYSTVIPTQQIWTLIMRLMNSSLPALNELLARGDWEGTRNAYFRISRYSLVLAVALSLGVLGFNRVVIGAWVGPARYAGDSLTVLLALYVPWSILESVQTQLLFAIGQARLVSTICVLESLSKIVLSLILGRLIGPVGVLLGTLLASLIAAPWAWRACLRTLRVTPLSFARESVFPVLASSAPLLALIVPWSLVQPVSVPVWGAALALFGAAWCATTWFTSLSAGDRLYLRGVAVRARTLAGLS